MPVASEKDSCSDTSASCRFSDSSSVCLRMSRHPLHPVSPEMQELAELDATLGVTVRGDLFLISHQVPSAYEICGT